MGKTNKSDPIIVGTEMRASGAVLVVLAALAVYAQSLTTDEWDLSTGLAMAHYSAAAYCEQADLEPWDCPICDGNTTGFVVTKYFLDPKTSTNAYVGYDESREMIVLAFEGSANFSNWVTNLEFFRVDFDYPNATGARVHGGFYKAYQSVGVDVEKDVGALVERFPTFQVYVTGHSLGGALAVFGALDVTLRVPGVPVTLYTFGEPRVGNKDFAEYATARLEDSIRVTHAADPVPHLPLRVMGFHHIATEVFEDKHGDITVCNGSGEDQKCSDGVIAPFKVKDHNVYLGVVQGTSGCTPSKELQRKVLYGKRRRHLGRKDARVI